MVMGDAFLERGGFRCSVPDGAGETPGAAGSFIDPALNGIPR
jgi:hypothetical protein